MTNILVPPYDSVETEHLRFWKLKTFYAVKHFLKAEEETKEMPRKLNDFRKLVCACVFLTKLQGGHILENMTYLNTNESGTWTGLKSTWDLLEIWNTTVNLRMIKHDFKKLDGPVTYPPSWKPSCQVLQQIQNLSLSGIEFCWHNLIRKPESGIAYCIRGSRYNILLQKRSVEVCTGDTVAALTTDCYFGPAQKQYVHCK